MATRNAMAISPWRARNARAAGDSFVSAIRQASPVRPGRECWYAAQGAPGLTGSGLSLGLVLQRLAERVLDLAAEGLLEDGQQRLDGDRAQALDGLGDLRPLLVGLAGRV